MGVTVRLLNPEFKYTKIQIDINWSGNRHQFSTDFQIPPDAFIPAPTKKHKASIDPRNKELKSYGVLLNDLLVSIDKVFNIYSLVHKRVPTKKELIEALKPKESEEIHEYTPPKSDFFEIYEEFLKELPSRTTKSGLMRKTTINHYVSLGNTLREFEKKAKFPLDISKINKVFYNKFRKYRLQDQENPVKPGTFGEQDIKLLKSFLEWAFWQEYPVDKIYKKFEKPRVEPDLRSLTEDQILLLWEMDLKDEQWKLDIFLNMISTCFSVSDQARYNSSWIQSVATYDKGVRTDRKVIVFKRQKSSSFCYIPFEDDLYFRPVFIFNKYNGELPKISDQYFNRWLKELSNKLNWGIDLSSKVARKTGATQRRRLGMNLENIMKITGHKSEKSLRSYLGMNVEDMLKDHADKAVYMKVS